jgi:hypothetical protein
MSWDKDGDVLALTNDKINLIYLYDINLKKTTQLDTSMGTK